jgi:hypothetical protein
MTSAYTAGTQVSDEVKKTAAQMSAVSSDRNNRA